MQPTNLDCDCRRLGSFRDTPACGRDPPAKPSYGVAIVGRGAHGDSFCHTKSQESKPSTLPSQDRYRMCNPLRPTHLESTR